ncbi:MAG: hypothetical protein ACE5EA_10440 [Nitrospirota bacterium]
MYNRIIISLVSISVFMISLLGISEERAMAQQGDAGIGEQTFFTVNGGKVKKTRTKINDAPTTRGEGDFLALPGAVIAFNVPRGKDTFIVTFSGECRLTNASPNDWVEVEVRLDGVPMKPSSPGNPMAFCSDDNWEMHSATFAKRVPAGSHTIQVFWKLVDLAPFAVLSGWLDDWTLNKPSGKSIININQQIISRQEAKPPVGIFFCGFRTCSRSGSYGETINSSNLLFIRLRTSGYIETSL